MITSTCLFFTGDCLAQFGIEGRRFPWATSDSGARDGEGGVGKEAGAEAGEGPWDVSCRCWALWRGC